MQWIVAVPDYAGTVTEPERASTCTGSPGSTRCATCSRGSARRSLPLTLVYATSRAMVGARRSRRDPVVRVLAWLPLLIVLPVLVVAGRGAGQPDHAHGAVARRRS